MNKELIKKRFGKNLKNYNENAKVQKRMAEKLVSMIPLKEFENILELGCGSGLLTDVLSKNIKYKSYLANDIVDECEKYIKSIDNRIDFFAGDMEDCIKNDKVYDLIISNAAFQWTSDLANFVDRVTDILSPNGILLFSTFGAENYREIVPFIDKSLKYYSASELLAALNKYNPTIEEEIHVMAFNSPKDVLKHMHYTGVNAVEEKHWTKKDFTNFENIYNNFCSYSPTLTYNPVYVKITKNSKTG